MNSDQVCYASTSGLEVGVLIQRIEQKWWLFHNGMIIVWGGRLMALVPPAILAFSL